MLVYAYNARVRKRLALVYVICMTAYVFLRMRFENEFCFEGK